ncbi:MAG TPA: glycosyltransferase, partial [Chloroflexota bacterium]|nr:glycosyltransferase [Chloroflexota bacterium]
QIVCAASTMLSWNGRYVDFVGGHLNFYGHGFQVDYGLEYNPNFYPAARPTPFACGGAMAIVRSVFLDVGGFDEDYFAFFEDVDLGWRLWLLGYAVKTAPRAIVYHRQHGTVRRMTEAQRFFLYERNALFSLYKNDEDTTLERILPAAIVLAQQRALLIGGVDPKALANGQTSGQTMRVPERTFSYLSAVDAFYRAMPGLQKKRQLIQQRRQRSDAEFFHQFPHGLRERNFPGKAYAEVQRRVIEQFALDDVLGRPTRRRVLVVSHEAVGSDMAGPAIRAWEIARALSAEFDVSLATPKLKPLPESPSFKVVGYQKSHDQSLVPAINAADVVIAFGYLLHELPVLRYLDKPLVVDVYDPFTLENLETYRSLPLARGQEVSDLYTRILNEQFRCGDYYLCASERQRDFWLGLLAANGRLNPANYADDPTFRHLIDVVPFGLPTRPPEATRPVLKGTYPGIGADDRIILWGGGIWQWLDPLTLIRAVDRLQSDVPNLRLFFMGKAHRDPGLVETMPIVAEAERLSDRLGLTDRHVFFNDWVPYAERAGCLLEADVGACLHRDHLEAHFAFRTRLLDYIWAGLPILCSRGDTLGELVERYDLGRVVTPQCDAEVVDALRDLLGDPSARERRATAFAEVRDQLSWNQVVAPLATFLRSPSLASDRRLGFSGKPDRSPGDLVVKPTALWQLPVKAMSALVEGGPETLRDEIDRFVRWKLGRA